MPAPVMQRAEQVLNNISYTLRNIQSETYATQDRIAEKTQEVYSNQKWVLYRKPLMETLSLVTYAIVAYNPNQLMKALRTTNREEALNFLSRSTGAISSLSVEPASVSAQATLQKLQSGQTEITTLHQSLQSMIQTHDAAIQRLQNMEGAARQAG